MIKLLNLLTRPNFKEVFPQIREIEGLLVPGQEEWLFETAKSLTNGAKIVEIGCFKGRSSASLAFGCLGSRKHVFSIDTFEGIYQDVADRDNLRPIFEKGFFDEWQSNINKNKLSQYITPLVINSQQAAELWRAPINMLFIDGSHKYEDVIADFENFYPYVVPNGIIGVHDVTPNWEGCFRAWNEHIKYKLSEIDAVTSLAFGKKPVQ